MKLNKKTALITGGTSGIGESCAELFASEGAHVAVVGSSDMAKAEAVVARIAAAGGTAKPYVGDLSRVSEIARVVAAVKADFGRIDILVNSAGVFYPTPVGGTSEADYDRMMDINVKGVFFCIHEVAPIMKAQGGGAIINISSVAGVMALGTYSAYSAAKAGINFMTKALAQELAGHGIQVNAILPGNTATPMNENIRTEAEFKPMLDAMAAATPSGRTYSEAIDMARAALFLASGDGRAMHGALLVMDEGFSLGM
jgi:NAD(P)-dependent dehydrogenase (short-subunit alcohol dehydrogenase family)